MSDAWSTPMMLATWPRRTRSSVVTPILSDSLAIASMFAIDRLTITVSPAIATPAAIAPNCAIRLPTFSADDANRLSVAEAFCILRPNTDVFALRFTDRLLIVATFNPQMLADHLHVPHHVLGRLLW